MMALCAAEGIGVIPWSPLARGLLARKPTPHDTTSTSRAESDPLLQQLYVSPQDQEIVETVAHIANERGIKPAQVALAWLLSKPALAAPIMGASKLHHLEDAAAAVEVVLRPEEIERLERPYLPKPTMGITPPYAYPKAGAVHDRNHSA